MVFMLRKVAQLILSTEKNGSPIIEVCSGAPPDEVTALHPSHIKRMLHNYWWQKQ